MSALLLAVAFLLLAGIACLVGFCRGSYHDTDGDAQQCMDDDGAPIHLGRWPQDFRKTDEDTQP